MSYASKVFWNKVAGIATLTEFKNAVYFTICKFEIFGIYMFDTFFHQCFQLKGLNLCIVYDLI